MSQPDQIAPSSVLRHLVRVTNGSGISRLAEPPTEIHKATKSPGNQSLNKLKSTKAQKCA
jgi:hypothetical protein